MTEGPINPDPEQQRADNLASRRQSHIGPLPRELEEEEPGERKEEGREKDQAEGGEAEERD